MESESNQRRESSEHPLTRPDVEGLLSRVASSADLDLSRQNLQQINLSYEDLRGATLYYADLCGANLRGAKLNGADLRGANLSEADLDGADLSNARLSDQSEHRVELSQANLRHAKLQHLDLRGFDLSGLDLENADLNNADLRGARLTGTNLCGADLSRALLHGRELTDARLVRDIGPTGWPEQMRRNKTRLQGYHADTQLLHGHATPSQQDNLESATSFLSDRDAYLLGERIITEAYDPVKARALFPDGFDFTLTRQMFDAWLAHSGQQHSERERNAMWIGFAHQFCDLFATQAE
jgi:hypothetical protein